MILWVLPGFATERGILTRGGGYVRVTSDRDVRCTELVNTLPKGQTWNYSIHGITLLDSEMYMLRVGRKTSDIAVYDLSTFKYECISPIYCYCAFF